MIKRETYMKRIRSFIGSDLVKVMTGIRRSGKSVMLELIQDELTATGVSRNNFISINFEDLRYSHLLNAMALHEEVLKRAEQINGKVYLFFDEIQEVTDWEKCINSFRVSLDCDIYITGSNANLLSGELATYLGGRYVEFVIYPFSFSEFLELYHTVDASASIQQCFQKYLLVGGIRQMDFDLWRIILFLSYFLQQSHSNILRDNRGLCAVFFKVSGSAVRSGIGNASNSKKRNLVYIAHMCNGRRFHVYC